jgi:hypothetical protein
MKFTFLIQLLLLCSTSFGQSKNDLLSKAFVYEYVRQFNNSDTITYAKNLTRSSISYLKEQFNKKSKSLRSFINDSLALTILEIKYIQNKLEQLKTFNWRSKLFNAGKIINGDKVWGELEKGKVREVDMFSNPIFIRNNTVCLFYHIHFKGLGGPDYFGFFRQVDGKWRPWITISSGILN